LTTVGCAGGHCKNLVGAWEAAATNLQGIVGVGAINCDEHKELCGAYDIRGFPTIKLFPSDQSPNPRQKGLPWYVLADRFSAMRFHHCS
jgi:hypothetical protein